MHALFWLIDTVIVLYLWVLGITVVLSWLVSFNVVNTRNRFVYQVGDVCYRLTEPVLRPIRRIVPAMGGLDLSPLIAWLLLLFLRNLLLYDVYPALA
jgi:YggT family protein